VSMTTPPTDSRLEYICDQLVMAVNAALQGDRVLDDNRVAVNPSIEHRMVVYWRTRPRRWELRRFKRLVRKVMRQLVRTDAYIRREDLHRVAPRYAPDRWNSRGTNLGAANGQATTG
jgi:hypothetical protein